LSEASRFLEHRTQTAILISEDDGKSWHEYARRFDDYWQAQAHAIDIQVVTQKLLMMKLEMVETHYLKTFEDKFGKPSPAFDAGAPTSPVDPNANIHSIVDHFDALKDFAETHPGVAIGQDYSGFGQDVGQKEIDDEIPF